MSPAHIISIVAVRHGLTSAEITGPCRLKHVSFARHVAMWLVRSRLHYSYPAIARAFRRADHTTVIYAVRKISDFMRLDPVFAADVEALLDQVRAPLAMTRAKQLEGIEVVA
jgi:chromosomal replication initiator protein